MLVLHIVASFAESLAHEVGQNPCGTTLTWERKQAIYALAQKHDLIIVEDDREYC